MANLSDSPPQLPRSRPRFVAFNVVLVGVLALLGGRVAQLQVLSSAGNPDAAGALGALEVSISAPRGLIFDRSGRPIAVNVAAWTVKVVPADVPQHELRAVLGRVAAVAGVEASGLIRLLENYRGSRFDLVPLVRGLGREAALVLSEERDRLPGVHVEAEPVRQYLNEADAPDGSLLSHVVGYMGPISETQLEALSGDGYLATDSVGVAGVESSFERSLSGHDGARLISRDATGRQGEVVEEVRAPVAGTNLMLTIDARMQRLASDALVWGMEVANVSQGVTIVMNPQTGEILAMASLPAYDNNLFARGISTQDFAAYVSDPTRPLRNHAISDIYPPGSTYKLVTALAALEEGVTSATRLWQTYGCYQIPDAADGACLYDWNRTGFGPLDIVDAFAKSSDTFFYQMATAVGIDRLAWWAQQLGFGDLTGIQLPAEEEGIVASTEWARAQGRSGVFTGELAQAGIGQSVIAVTPLQMLNAYAALANGGRLMEPMIVRGETDSAGNLVEPYEPRVIREIAADPAHLETLRIAAREVITSGHAYNISDLRLPGALSGKTGTAEFGELTPGGTLPFHSWFVAYLPSAAGATDAELAVLSFSYSATVPGNVSAEVVKYFLQLHFELEQDLRLDPNDFSLVDAN